MAELAYAFDLGSNSCRFESCWVYRKVSVIFVYTVCTDSGDFPNYLFTAFHNMGNAHYQRHFPHDIHGDGESRWARESSPLGI